jgi:hypothetical protein
MTSIGVWACQWRELRPINFGVKPGNGTGIAQPSLPDENDGAGQSRGRGRGRGRDGAGEYEMVGLEGDRNV